MKQKFKNSTALLLAILLILMTGFFTLKTESFYKVKADTTVETEFDYFSQSYFKNLTTNFGRNYKGSCMFIAAEMLFSYYDNCVSDTIIPEKYDKVYSAGTPFVYLAEDSPGTKDDVISVAEWQVATGQTLFDEEIAEDLYIYEDGAIYEEDGDRFDEDDDYDYVEALSIGQYMDIVQTKVNESLHCKLLTIGEDGHVNFSEEHGCGIIEGTLRNIMADYLLNEVGYEENVDYSFYCEYIPWVPTQLTQNGMRANAVEKIESGEPVILFISQIDSDGEKQKHAVIAYDYDENLDEIYCHYGYHDKEGSVSTKHLTMGAKGYENIHGYISIDWNLGHTCSNNYVIGDTSYCYQNKNLYIYDGHNCIFNEIHEFEQGHALEHQYHKIACHCTEYNAIVKHTSSCLCIRSEHQPVSYTYWDSKLHRVECEYCDDKIYEVHVANIRRPNYCIICKSTFEVGFGEIMHPENLNGRLVTENGSYVGLYGIIYLDERDVQAYFNGTLVFYKEDSSAQIA